MVLLDHLVLQDQPDRWVRSVWRELRDQQDPQGPRDRRVSLVFQDLTDQLDPQVHQEH